MMRRVLSILFLVCAVGCLVEVRAQKKPEMRRIYIFGFGASFTDSIACQTDIQVLDSAWIDPSHKFLIDRSLYSLQLQNHMENVEKCKNSVCTVFFDQNQRRLQRTWNKIKKRYSKADALRFSVVPEDRFHFKAEEYRPIVMQEAASTPTPPKGNKPPQRKK